MGNICNTISQNKCIFPSIFQNHKIDYSVKLYYTLHVYYDVKQTFWLVLFQFNSTLFCEVVPLLDCIRVTEICQRRPGDLSAFWSFQIICVMTENLREFHLPDAIIQPAVSLPYLFAMATWLPVALNLMLHSCVQNGLGRLNEAILIKLTSVVCEKEEVRSWTWWLYNYNADVIIPQR